MSSITKIQTEKNVSLLRNLESLLNVQIKELQSILEEKESSERPILEQQLDLMLELKRTVLRTVYQMTEKPL